MVQRRRLQARKLDASAGTSNAIDDLLRNSVLVTAAGDREVAFRHHILFDYIASRTFIDLDDLEKTKSLLASDKGLGLLLAPSLSYGLQHLWEIEGSGRTQFWEAAAFFAGDADSDPVARSVAARLASDLPEVADDMTHLIQLMHGDGPDGERAKKAFSHIVGSLTVRLEDNVEIHPEPWCHLAAGTADLIEQIAWPLRTLLYTLLERVKGAYEQADLGKAARALLAHSLSAGSEALTSIAIGFVGKTFATDPAESRKLAEQLLAPERMALHAHNEMDWLAREITSIAETDSELAATIYRRVFEHEVDDDAPTAMGQSQILALTSSRRQEYKMARWSLKETFPEFLKLHPVEATRAMLWVAKAHTDNEHPLRDSPKDQAEVTLRGRTFVLKADYSCAWAQPHGNLTATMTPGLSSIVL